MVRIKEDGRIYWSTLSTSLMLLIPKKRGKGFLKSPVYHESTPLTEFISDEFHCDCFGLDGYLDLKIDTHDNDECLRIVKVLAEYLKFDYEPSRVSSDAFLKYLIKPNKG
jgi:hypothetical protein